MICLASWRFTPFSTCRTPPQRFQGVGWDGYRPLEGPPDGHQLGGLLVPSRALAEQDTGVRVLLRKKRYSIQSGPELMSVPRWSSVNS